MNIQPVYDELHLAVAARLEFASGLAALASEKLSLDLPQVRYSFNVDAIENRNTESVR